MQPNVRAARLSVYRRWSCAGRPLAPRARAGDRLRPPGTSGAGRRASTPRVAQNATQRALAAATAAAAAAVGQKPDGRRRQTATYGSAWARMHARVARHASLREGARLPRFEPGAKRRPGEPRTGRASADAGLIEQAGCTSFMYLQLLGGGSRAADGARRRLRRYGARGALVAFRAARTAPTHAHTHTHTHTHTRTHTDTHTNTHTNT